MKNKEKGFTVTELIAGLTILSIILAIAIPSFSGLISKFGNSYYKSVEETIKTAGIDYFTDNKKILPKYVGETVVVPISRLVNGNYVEGKITDKSGEEIKNVMKTVDGVDNPSNYVIAYKSGKGKYEYTGCLNIENYESKNEYCNDEYLIGRKYIVPPANRLLGIPLNYKLYKELQEEGKELDSLELYNANVYISSMDFSKEDQDLKIERTTPKVETDGIVTDELVDVYSIRIKSETIDKTYEAKESETSSDIKESYKNYIRDIIEAGNIESDYEENVKNLLEDNPKIIVTYKTDEKKVSSYYKLKGYDEFDKIEIGMEVEGTTGYEIGDSVNLDNISWSNIALNTTVGPKNINLDTTGKTINYICEDESGNKFSCFDDVVNLRSTEIIGEKLGKYKVYGVNAYNVEATNEIKYGMKVDTYTPEITTISKLNTTNNNLTSSTRDGYDNYASGTWTKENVYLDFNVRNRVNVSGTTTNNCNEFNIKEEKNETYSCTATTGAGNQATSGVEVKIDKTAPECESSGGSETWTNSSRTLIGTCYDQGGSECVNNASWLIDWEAIAVNLSPGKVFDYAGNETMCPANQTVKIDQTTPSLTVNVYKKNNKDNLNNSNSASGLASYTNDTWYDGYTFVTVSDSYGLSGGSVNCTDSRENLADFTSYRNVNTEGTTTITCTATGNNGLTNTITKTIKLDRCGDKSSSTSWGDWTSTCDSSNNLTRTGTTSYTSNLSGKSCGSTSVSDSKDCDLSVICTATNLTTNCKSSAGNYIIGRVKVVCNRPIDAIRTQYYYEGTTCKNSKTNYAEDKYPSSSWSSAKNGAMFNFRGCNGSDDLTYKVEVKLSKTWTQVIDWTNFDGMGIKNVDTACNPTSGGHWFN